MYTRSLVLVAVGLLFCTGCLQGPASQGAGTTDPEVANGVRDQVTAFVKDAQKSPKAAKGRLDLMLESLDGAAARGGAFVTVRDEAKKLQSLYESKADTAALKKQMDALQAAADGLTSGAS